MYYSLLMLDGSALADSKAFQLLLYLFCKVSFCVVQIADEFLAF